MERYSSHTETQQEVQSSEKILKETINNLKELPNFPDNYCNVASKELLKNLEDNNKTVRLQFTYLEPGIAHTYIVETFPNGEEFIIDPTYSQYEETYYDGFIGKYFPNIILEQHRSEGKEFMKLQKKRFLEGVYDEAI